MKKIFLLFISLFWCSCIYAQTDKKVTSIKELIPEGWEAIDTIYGDLNKDGIYDIALILEEQDKNNLIPNTEGMGADTLNINPRKIVIAFKEGLFYKLVLENESFLPSQNSSENSCLMDPLEDGEILINNGVLKIRLHYWYSCGSWYISDNTYSFRYQNNKFELIGFDSSSFHRASGESSSVSINYSTKKKQTITGYNEFEESESKPKEKWENIKIDKLLNLESKTSEMELIGL